MNAKEAREKALSVNTENSNSQYFQIIQMIADAANKGQYYITFEEHIREDVVERLISQGYNVGVVNSHRDEMCTKISW